MTVLQFLIALFAFGVGADAAKILVMVQTPSPSLFNLYSPIIEALHARKHELTVQSLFPLKKPLPSVRVLTIKPAAFGEDEEMTKKLLLTMASATPIGSMLPMPETIGHMCHEYLSDESTKELLKGGKQFDLVISDGFLECGLTVATMLGDQVIDLLGCGNFPWLYSDAPVPPSYIPNFFRRITSKMTFWQRINNAIDIAGFRLIYEYKIVPTVEKITSEYIPNAPSLEDVHDKVSLTITNGDPVMSSPRPSMPTVIECGGTQCTDGKPLPKDFKDFVESSGDEGFIIMGLGTNMKSKFLAPEVREAILTAFSRLKIKVVWKFEAQLENCPKNVKITKWMPQQDLLAHPKCRLFITHSGLLSLQEAVYHGVPVIGMPFFMDQAGNIGRIQELGIGEYVDFFNITTDGFYDIIKKVLTEKSYRDNARKYSAIFKDQPMKPLDKAMYWIEYVIRHGGARHFRPASRDLNFFQYFLLDVIAFLLIISAAAIGIVVFLMKLVLKKLFAKKHSAQFLEKKKK